MKKRRDKKNSFLGFLRKEKSEKDVHTKVNDSKRASIGTPSTSSSSATRDVTNSTPNSATSLSSASVANPIQAPKSITPTPSSAPTATPSSAPTVTPSSAPTATQPNPSTQPSNVGTTQPIKTPIGGVSPGASVLQELSNKRAPPPAPTATPQNDPETSVTSRTTTELSSLPEKLSPPESIVVPYEQIKVKKDALDQSKLESYLSDEEFIKILGSTREVFYKMPMWKQNNKKRQLGLL